MLVLYITSEHTCTTAEKTSMLLSPTLSPTPSRSTLRNQRPLFCLLAFPYFFLDQPTLSHLISTMFFTLYMRPDVEFKLHVQVYVSLLLISRGKTVSFNMIFEFIYLWLCFQATWKASLSRAAEKFPIWVNKSYSQETVYLDQTSQSSYAPLCFQVTNLRKLYLTGNCNSNTDL